jgi:hypothetical protein
MNVDKTRRRNVLMLYMEDTLLYELLQALHEVSSAFGLVPESWYDCVLRH